MKTKKKLLFILFCASFALSAQPPYVPSSGLMGYWPFTGNANDVSGNNYNGTVFGATLINDRFGNANCAYRFNGVSNFILTSYAGIAGNSARAISFWAQTATDGAPPPQGPGMYAVGWGANGGGSSGVPGTAVGERFSCGVGRTPGNPFFDGGYSVVNYPVANPSVKNTKDGQWHHYVYQFSGGTGPMTSIQVYMDAVPLTAVSILNGSMSFSTVIYSTVQFGRVDYPAKYEWFNGALDDIGIWNRVLDPCEIKKLYLAQSMDYSLADISHTIKTTYCIGEDVFLYGVGASATHFKVELQPTSSNPLITEEVFSGDPNGLNVSEVFTMKHGVNFQPNIPYQVKLIIDGPCGCTSITRNFNFTCCQSSTNAFFTIHSTSQGIELNSSNYGAHTWKVYKFNEITEITQPMPMLYFAGAQPNKRKVDVEAGGPCYYIRHEVLNACGTGCAAQRYCDFNCEDNECDLSVPENLLYDPATLQLSWNPVSGAGSYIVEIYEDPYCCNPPPGPMPAPVPIKTILTQDLFYNINPMADFDWAGPCLPCFRWVVYAKCPDGTLSAGTEQCISNTCGSFVTGLSSINNENSVKLFPNPATKTVYIEIDLPDNTGFEINLFDATGKLLKTIEHNSTASERSLIKLNTEDLAKGIYLLSITTSDNCVINKKLVID